MSAYIHTTKMLLDLTDIFVDGGISPSVDPQGGYAHVAFSDAESMKKALQLNGTKVGKKACCGTR